MSLKILVADQDARLLKAITATFGRHCDIATATSRDECLARLGHDSFDLIVAGDRLAGYSGLELLSEVAAAAPATLRLFLAGPARLQELAPRLEFFGLFATLTYPLDPRKLLAELHRARESLKDSTASRKIRHVVLQDEWDTGERQVILEADPVAGEALPEPPLLASAVPEPGAATAVAIPPPAAAVKPQPASPARGTIEVSTDRPFEPSLETRSLSELAHIALKKQPLPVWRPKQDSRRRPRTWLRLLAGSGIAAVALAAVFTLKVAGRDHATRRAVQPAPAATTQLFSSGTSVGTNSAGVPTLSVPPSH